jgi:hypothetical protein
MSFSISSWLFFIRLKNWTDLHNMYSCLTSTILILRQSELI